MVQMKKFVQIRVGHSFCGQMQSLRWALANASIDGYEPFKIDCDVQLGIFVRN